MLPRKIVLILIQTTYLTVVATITYLFYKKNPRNTEKCIKIPERYEILQSGNFIVDNVKFKLGEYFFERNGTIRVCPISYCYFNEKACVVKCAPQDYIIDNFTNAVGKHLKIEETLFNEFDKIVTRRMPMVMTFMFLCNGASKINFSTKTFPWNNSQPFLNELLNRNSFEYCYGFTKTRNSTVDFSFICDSKPNSLPRSRRFRYYTHFLFISVVFFAITLFIYAIIPELRRHKRSLLGICLLNHLACLLVAYILALFTRFEFSRSPVNCKLISYVFYYIYTAGKLWTNALCYDMCSTIRCMKTTSRSRVSSIKKTIFYSLYSYGIPLLFTITLYILDTFMLLEDNIFKPDMGNPNRNCYISNRYSNWLFTCAITGFVLITNIKLTVDIGWVIEATFLKVKRSLNNNEIRSTNDCQSYNGFRLMMYSNLCVASGVLNALEIIAFFSAETILEWWWLPADIANSSRGLLTFVVFILNRPTLRILNQKFFSSLSLLK